MPRRAGDVFMRVGGLLLLLLLPTGRCDETEKVAVAGHDIAIILQQTSVFVDRRIRVVKPSGRTNECYTARFHLSIPVGCRYQGSAAAAAAATLRLTYSAPCSSDCLRKSKRCQRSTALATVNDVTTSYS